MMGRYWLADIVLDQLALADEQLNACAG